MAMLYAYSTNDAYTSVNYMLAVVKPVRSFRTNAETLGAIYASDRQKTEFRFFRPRFGIMAPAAAHRASF